PLSLHDALPISSPRARRRAARARRPHPLRGPRAPGRDGRDGTGRRLCPRAGRRLLHHGEALGPPPVRASGPRAPSPLDRRALPPCLRRAPPSSGRAARGVPPPGPHAPRPRPALVPLLVARKGPDGSRPPPPP